MVLISSHKSHLKLSPQAQKDFTDILRYTGEWRGHEQLLAYGDKLNDALMLLGQNPQLGHPSRELPDTHRLYFVRSHVIVYRTRQDATEVVRILHQRMSITRHVFGILQNTMNERGRAQPCPVVLTWAQPAPLHQGALPDGRA